MLLSLSYTLLFSYCLTPLAATHATPLLHPRDVRAACQDAASTGNGTPSYFLNAKSQEFVVDGLALPNVSFDIGESYAGLLPVSAKPHEKRKLFFWFFPSTNPDAGSTLTIWFAGGPGCSSLTNFLRENGPFVWQAGHELPERNPYTWTNLTNMLWVEQPVGVGYTQGYTSGESDILDDVGNAHDFVGFYKQFADTFNLQNWNVYLTGSSYAGHYVSYTADAFIEQDDRVYYNLKGILVDSPLIGDPTSQDHVVNVPYVDYWSNLLYLNDTFVKLIHERADECHYTSYLEQYLQYPPPSGSFPLPNRSTECEVQAMVFAAAGHVNPCFDFYHISKTCPEADSGYYFERDDVQRAINAPEINDDWQSCSTNIIGKAENFGARVGMLPGPAQNGVLQRVIEYTNNTIIGSGNLDMRAPTNGTLLALQNMTWNGMQGFQAYPDKMLRVPAGARDDYYASAEPRNLGRWGSERGLTFCQVQLAGHGLTGNAPSAAYRMMELLLGRIESLSEPSGFITETGVDGIP